MNQSNITSTYCSMWKILYMLVVTSLYIEIYVKNNFNVICSLHKY